MCFFFFFFVIIDEELISTVWDYIFEFVGTQPFYRENYNILPPATSNKITQDLIYNQVFDDFKNVKHY